MTISPAPASLPAHKRRPSKGPGFTIPNYACWACEDTGIVSNGDGLVNDWLPDYDITPDGVILPGSDPACICQCLAAYPSSNQPGRGGFRDSAGPRAVETLNGQRFAGVQFPQAGVQALHTERKRLGMAGIKHTAQAARLAAAAMTTASIGSILPPTP
ncbi:MAG: hypothetical protein N3Z28_00725 [Synechococcaceae cyanobacterium MAG-AL2]|uniref:hypothetical protein n=1 Tax=Candidatus Regnicoccus frigidus TaxID=3074015 RepID=UPI00281B39DE|nr:hypothetical protein [Candidatus Regnicoccus frigidus]MCT4366177.1 hypothetical protein [Candidatus Regnicoccus frigidus MAG-AL2]